MKDIRTIRLAVGIGDLKFGVRSNEIRKYLGEPDDISVGGDGDSVMWHYDSIDGYVTFEEEDDNRLGSAEVSDPEATLFGMKLIGRDQDTVLLLLAGRGLGESNQEFSDCEDDGDERNCLISYQEKGLNLWFEDDTLESIQWGVVFNDQDEIVWPD